MLGRQERLAILLLVGVAISVIIAHLALDQIGKRAFATNFSEQSQEGDLVIVSGKIDTVTLTRSGGHCILVVNNLSVFIPNQIADGQSFTQGTNISVIGTIQTYQGKKELLVQSASDIILTE
jgi:ABC-type uncharacterized transport system YnjBCD permease subunit